MTTGVRNESFKPNQPPGRCPTAQTRSTAWAVGGQLVTSAFLLPVDHSAASPFAFARIATDLAGLPKEADQAATAQDHAGMTRKQCAPEPFDDSFRGSDPTASQNPHTRQKTRPRY